MKRPIMLIILVLSLSVYCNCDLLDSLLNQEVTTDSDNDGIVNNEDNCPDNYNPNQNDSDNNGIGDACDTAQVNQNPKLNFMQPTNGSLVEDNLEVVVNASDPDGEISSVDLYIDNKLVRKDTSSPYKWGVGSGFTDNALLNLSNGSYTLKATATDDEGGTKTVSITVTVDYTPPVNNLCGNYPPSDNGFGLGDVIRNYTMYDENDNMLKMCEFGGGQHYKVMFLAVAATW